VQSTQTSSDINATAQYAGWRAQAVAAHGQPPSDSGQAYTYWQSTGYYDTFSAAQQAANQSLAPLAGTSLLVDHLRADPGGGVSISSNPDAFSLAANPLALQGGEFANYQAGQTAVQQVDGETFNNASPWGPGTFLMIQGSSDAYSAPPPPASSSSSPGQPSTPPTVGTPPNHSPSTALNQ